MNRVQGCLIAASLSLPLIGVISSPEAGLAQGSDPGEPGTLEVETREYNFGDEAFTPTGFPAAVELRASVHHPKDLSGGPFPLVVLLHGRHATCYPITAETQLAWPCPSGSQPIPSFEGYDYIGDILSSYGYIVVSISANGVNSKDDEPTVPDNGALARAEVIQRHLEIWKDMNTGSGVVDPFGVAPFGELFVGKVDLSTVGTMGHSRGGEGVVRNFLLNLEEGAPFGVRAVFALAPTNSNRLVINNVPLAVLLPYCDGDLFALEGVHYYDDARYNIAGDAAAKHNVLVMGANHNFYNTVWTPGLFPEGASDDWLSVSEDASSDPHCGPAVSGNGRLNDDEQRGTGIAYASAFFRVYVGGETQFLPVLAGDPPPPSAKTSEIHVSYHAPDDPTLRRDLSRLTAAANLTTNTLGGAASQIGLSPYEFCGVSAPCLPGNVWQIGREPHFRGLGQLSAGWTQTSAVYRNEIPTASRDISAFQWFQFRVSVDFTDPSNPAGSPQDFSIVLVDGTGKTASVQVSQWSRALFYPPGDASLFTSVPKTVLNMVRIPLPAFTGVNLSDIRTVEFRFDREPSGALLISDLALAGTRAVLPPPPAPSFPRMPICGDQDGSETPFILRCTDLLWAGDVQLYQVPGTGPVQLRFDFVFREAAFNNELAFFLVDDALGRIDGIVPSEPGYLAAAFARAQLIFPSGSNAFTPDVSLQLEGGNLIVFFIVQNSRLSTLLADNPNNELNKRPLAFFSFNALNPDGIDHFVGYDNPALDITHFGFEDLTGGGDRNFDDIVYNVVPRLQPLTARVHLSPLSAEKAVGESHALTAEVQDKEGDPVAGELVVFEVRGANPTTGSASTNANGMAIFSYVGSKEGDDTVVARTSEATSNTVIVVWRSRCPIRVFFGGSQTASETIGPAHQAKVLIQPLQQAVDVVRLLERVRDEVLTTTPQGQRYIELFDLHGREITDLMLTDEALRDQGILTVEAFVPALQAFVNGHGNEVIVTADQVGIVLALLEELSAASGTELAQDIASELARRPLEPIVGMTMDEAWVYLNNLPPVAAAGGPYEGDEGETVTVDASGSTDPDDNIFLYEWDLDDDGEFDDATGVTTEATFGDNGTFTIDLKVTDELGESATDTAEVIVNNLPPTVALEVSDAVTFAGGNVFLGRAGIAQTHEAAATDPGSDDLTFTWSFAAVTTYFNDGAGPDLFPSPGGGFPFAAMDRATTNFADPGIHQITVVVSDDDGGTASATLPKLVTGTDECTRSQGFWKHQFSGQGKEHIDNATLQAYLEVVNFASAVFSESVPASTLAEAKLVIKARGSGTRAKAQAQLLAAWLNFANGAVERDEAVPLDDDDDGAPTLPFHELISQAETILLDLDASRRDLKQAKDLAEAVNLLDEDNEACEDVEDNGDNDEGRWPGWQAASLEQKKALHPRRDDVEKGTV